MYKFSRFVSCLTLLLTITATAFGLDATGTIRGTVKDPSRATVPAASVTVTNENTGQSLTFRTGQHGNYIATKLPSGRYRVKVKAVGFCEAVSEGNAVVVSGTTRVNFLIQVEAPAESIEVRAIAPMIETAPFSINAMIEPSHLPLRGYTWIHFASGMY